MPSFEDLALASMPRPGTVCTVCAWLDSLDQSHPDVAADVRRTVANESISATGIVGAITSAGLPPMGILDPGQAIKRHRAKLHDWR